jgi:hypothetical protein
MMGTTSGGGGGGGNFVVDGKTTLRPSEDLLLDWP